MADNRQQQQLKKLVLGLPNLNSYGSCSSKKKEYKIEKKRKTHQLDQVVISGINLRNKSKVQLGVSSKINDLTRVFWKLLAQMQSSPPKMETKCRNRIVCKTRQTCKTNQAVKSEFLSLSLSSEIENPPNESSRLSPPPSLEIPNSKRRLAQCLSLFYGLHYGFNSQFRFD